MSKLVDDMSEEVSYGKIVSLDLLLATLMTVLADHDGATIRANNRLAGGLGDFSDLQDSAAPDYPI